MSHASPKPPAAYAVDSILPSSVVAPRNLDDLSVALKEVHSAGQAAIPWGGGTRMHVGNVPRRYDVALRLVRLDQIVEYEPADLTVIVQAGVTIASLQAELVRQGQRLPFDPPSPHLATIGGSLASNAAGPLRSAFGGIRDFVIGMKVVHADGTITKSGGNVVKNVSGYDLMRPHIGAFGTLGVIAEAGFKLIPLPRSVRTIAAEFGSLESAEAACKRLMSSPFVPERLSLFTGTVAASALASLRGAKGDTGGEACLLLTTLAGGPNATARMVDETARLIRAAGPAWHDEPESAVADAVFALAEQTSENVPRVTARATLNPTDCFQFLRSIYRDAAAGPLTPGAVVHVGFGTVILHWRPARASFEAEQLLQATRSAIEQSRNAAARFGGNAVIERCPVELKSQVDIWGDVGPSIEIMRMMKTQFDPAGVLNPGRFVGGI
ncbi:MAG: FAD-binding oxidoreductase [Chloroflexi bacterium]|nr:FAD-binding oxidoreductase [Chloroflexota bacterium]